VALLVASAVALLSFLFPHPLPLSFRPVELVAMGGAAAVVALAVANGRSTRRAGVVLVSLYAVVVVGFWVAGDR
jgi:Ca2+/H+ antiporter